MRIVRYLLDVLRFSTKASPWVYIILFLAVFGTILEFIALSVLVPLTQSVNHSSMSVISRSWNDLLSTMISAPSTKTWF